MSSQADLKRRLNALMKKPENMICSDCPERQPRWASLIVPPPGSPPDSLPIGAFCCLECSGSHRRLGVHISFVRSVNLDSWKEREVLAMENGGNAKVNAIFEAHLAHSGSIKPSNQASGPTRERFIRDKYERRKFYDANLMKQYLNGDLNDVDHIETSAEDKPGTGQRRPLRAPSEAAKKRAEARKSRLSTKTTSPKKAPAPAAPAQSNIVDLLDFDVEPTASSTTGTHDPFSVTHDPFNPPAPVAPAPAPSQPLSAPPAAAPPAPTPTLGSSVQVSATTSNFTSDPFSVTTQTTQTSKHMESTMSKETSTTKEEYSLSMLETSTTSSTPKPVMNSNDIMKLFNQPGSNTNNAMLSTGSTNGMGMSSDVFGGLANMNPAMSNGSSNQYNGAGTYSVPTMGGNGTSMNSMTMPTAVGGGGQSLQQQQYMLQQQMLLLQQQQQMQMMMKQMNFNSTTATAMSSATDTNGQSMSYHQNQTTQMRTNNYYGSSVADVPGGSTSSGFGFGDMAPMGGVTQYNQNTGGGGGIAMSQLNMMNRVNNVNLSGGTVGTATDSNAPVVGSNSKPKDDRFSDLGNFGFNS